MYTFFGQEEMSEFPIFMAISHSIWAIFISFFMLSILSLKSFIAAAIIVVCFYGVGACLSFS